MLLVIYTSNFSKLEWIIIESPMICCAGVICQRLGSDGCFKAEVRLTLQLVQVADR